MIIARKCCRKGILASELDGAQVQDRTIRLVCHLTRCADQALKFVVVGIALYLAFEIGSAFLPGGAAHRVIGGGQ